MGNSGFTNFGGSGQFIVPNPDVPTPPEPPPQPPVKPSTNLGSSPGLSTSTGGLFNSEQAFLIPVFDTLNNKTWFDIVDPTNFNCEDDAFYYFPSQECAKGLEGKEVTIHNVVLTYREIGKCKFTVGVIVYVANDDNFIFKEVSVEVADVKGELVDSVNLPFPDNQLHTIKLDLVLQGQRPIPYLKRNANDGPMSVTNFMLVGQADVPEIM